MIKKIINKLFQVFSKKTEEQEQSNPDVTPQRQLTEAEAQAQAKAIAARLTLLTMLIMSICGYCVLYGVNGILANYLLGGNLIALANYIFFKSY